ncbi:hypothetical protein [Arthrobacter sp. ZGTC412]|uniref:hypothetical protein n=1 Tax=Arthrobacter sp. ZGTC412 TaxID=2058900 RepID=UPI0011B00CB6|nr:hypothetical protein [Arthrobacter sp. ZGTC412]
MNFLHDAALKKPSNRHQFGKVPGGAAVLLAGATYGAVTIAFELEFSDGAHENVLRLAVPPVTRMEAFS